MIQEYGGFSQIYEEICAKEGVNNLWITPSGGVGTKACDKKKILEEFSNHMSMVDILFPFLILPHSGKNSTLIYPKDQFHVILTPGALGGINSPLIHLQGGYLTNA